MSHFAFINTPLSAKVKNFRDFKSNIFLKYKDDEKQVYGNILHDY